MKIGVLALQGDFSAHQRCLEYQQVSVVQVREPQDLEALAGLVLPGGESSVMSRLLLRYHLFEPLKQKIQQGLPIFATCAGLILLSKQCHPPVPRLLDVLPIEVERNAYGPQAESRVCQIAFPEIASEALEVCFIRAPVVTRYDPSVTILSVWKQTPIVLKYQNIFAMTCHPELQPQTPFYSYWLKNFVTSSVCSGERN